MEDLINPLWTDLLSHVDEAWLALDSCFMHPDEDRLPTWCFGIPISAGLRRLCPV